MTASGSNTNSLGYLTFVEIPNHGVVGGYLIVNQRARPVEFHCTAPVFSNRTQEILFGETFRTALLCDQIGAALLGQASQRPSLLLTDEPVAAGLRRLFEVPMAVFIKSGQETRYQQAVYQGAEWYHELTDSTVTDVAGFEQDREIIRETLKNVESGFDVTEPLERIRAAINEAQRAAA